jgi:anti-sigma regulatory factor (Ser/Thr protein kinase)
MEDLLLFSIQEASQVGEARRAASGLARLLGFNVTIAEKVAIVTTELASNLVKHTNGGQLLIQPLEQQGIAGIELLSLDQGPGMADVAACLRDGYSTAGSRGEGLGAIRRLAAVFDVYSLETLGTAVLAQLWAQPLPKESPRARLELGVICLPKPGEAMNGDSWAMRWQAGHNFILIVDGLGHGPGAATAAHEAVRVFQNASIVDPAVLLEKMHQALHSTRGAVVALAAITPGNQATFVGVGNIAGTVLTEDRVQHTISHNGTVGHTIHRIQPFAYPWTTQSLLILHSDGLGTRWNLNAYPGLRERHPSLIAGVLYRDFKRGTDDVTVLVVKELP